MASSRVRSRFAVGVGWFYAGVWAATRAASVFVVIIRGAQKEVATTNFGHDVSVATAWGDDAGVFELSRDEFGNYWPDV